MRYKRFLSRTEDGFTLMDTLISLFIFSLIVIGLFRFFTYSLDLIDIRMSVAESQNDYLDLEYKLTTATKTESLVSITSNTLIFSKSEFTIQDNTLLFNGYELSDIQPDSTVPFRLEGDLVYVHFYLLHDQERILFSGAYRIAY